MAKQQSTEASNADVIQELVKGENAKQFFEAQREANSARIAEDYKGTKSKGGLMHLAEIPQREFFLLTQWLGDGWWKDRAVIKHLQKTHPQFFSHNA